MELQTIPTQEELDGMVIMNADLDKNKSINFLIEYSHFLIKKNKFDDKILNWQVENSAILKPMGLDYIFLKKRLEEKNKMYYKYDSLINQLSYRLEKHGKLAPTKEIAKRFDQIEMGKSLNNNKEDQLQNPDEINFYDLNDPFINDDEVVSDNSDNEFFNITLAYGNHSEDAVIRNLQRSKKSKKRDKEKSKKKASTAGTGNITTNITANNTTNICVNNNSNLSNEIIIESAVDQDDNINNFNMNCVSPQINNLNNINNISSPITSKQKLKKRKFNEMNNQDHNNDLNNFYPLQIQNQAREKNEKETLEEEKVMKSSESNNVSFSDELEKNILANLINEEYPKDSKDQITFLKKMLIYYKKAKEEDSSNSSKVTIFLTRLSKILSSEAIVIQTVLNFEALKIKREGIYSNLAKQINKFILFLTENNIRSINAEEPKILHENPEVKEKLLTILTKINVYLDSIKSVMDFSDEEDNSARIEKIYQSKKIGLISLPEGKDKVVRKFKELLDKQQVLYSDDSLISFLNVQTDSPFVNYQIQNINQITNWGSNSKPGSVFKSANKSEYKNTQNIIDLYDGKDEIRFNSNIFSSDKANINMNALNVKSKNKKSKSKITQNKVSKKKKKENLEEELDQPENINQMDMKIQKISKIMKTPEMSRRFYVKEFDDDDFI